MTKYLSRIFLLFFLLSLSPLAASAQETALDVDTIRQQALDAILPTYSDWGSAELTGRLRMDRLPVSPTVKIYMKKGTAISISVRASLFGEVGRIDIAGDSILAINKLKRVYCNESIAHIINEYPSIIQDVQSLLLGRVVAFQSGQLSHRNADSFDFFELVPGENEEDFVKGWVLSYPKGRTDSDIFGYEYTVNCFGQIEDMVAAITSANVAMLLEYRYPGSGNAMHVALFKDDRAKLDATMQFDAVKWGAQPMQAPVLGGRYQKVGLRDFIKSLKF